MSPLLDRLYAACLTAGVGSPDLRPWLQASGTGPTGSLRGDLTAALLHAGSGVVPEVARLITVRREAQTAALLATLEDPQGAEGGRLDSPEETPPEDEEWEICGPRLGRASRLSVTPEGDGYRVTGGSEPRLVSSALVCSCPDQATRLCKHVLAVLLRRGVALRAGMVLSLPAAGRAAGPVGETSAAPRPA